MAQPLHIHSDENHIYSLVSGGSMKIKQINRLTPLLILGFVLIAGFQNCSPSHNFAIDTKSNKVAGSGNPLPEEVEQQQGQPQIPAEKCQVVEQRDVRLEGNISVVACPDNSDEKCALVCHVPRGNPSARHNIIVGMAARLGPHAPGGHGGDYDGVCSNQPSIFEACIED
jgi:hypothetical protein